MEIGVKFKKRISILGVDVLTGQELIIEPVLEKVKNVKLLKKKSIGKIKTVRLVDFVDEFKSKRHKDYEVSYIDEIKVHLKLATSKKKEFEWREVMDIVLYGESIRTTPLPYLSQPYLSTKAYEEYYKTFKFDEDYFKRLHVNFREFFDEELVENISKFKKVSTQYYKVWLRNFKKGASSIPPDRIPLKGSKARDLTVYAIKMKGAEGFVLYMVVERILFEDGIGFKIFEFGSGGVIKRGDKVNLFHMVIGLIKSILFDKDNFVKYDLKNIKCNFELKFSVIGTGRKRDEFKNELKRVLRNLFIILQIKGENVLKIETDFLNSLMYPKKFHERVMKNIKDGIELVLWKHKVGTTFYGFIKPYIVYRISPPTRFKKSGNDWKRFQKKHFLINADILLYCFILKDPTPENFEKYKDIGIKAQILSRYKTSVGELEIVYPKHNVFYFMKNKEYRGILRREYQGILHYGLLPTGDLKRFTGYDWVPFDRYAYIEFFETYVRGVSYDLLKIFYDWLVSQGIYVVSLYAVDTAKKYWNTKALYFWPKKSGNFMYKILTTDDKKKEKSIDTVARILYQRNNEWTDEVCYKLAKECWEFFKSKSRWNVYMKPIKDDDDDPPAVLAASLRIPPKTPKRSKKSIKLTFGGDVMLGRLYNDIFKKYPNYKVWGKGVLGKFKESDLIVFNLETTITKHDEPFPGKVFNYKLNPDFAEVPLKEPFGGKCIVSLANNHSLDFHKKGMRDTMNVLDKFDIKYTGAGGDLEEAMELVKVVINGVVIGLLASTDTPGGYGAYKTWGATNNRRGVWYINPYGDYTKELEYIKECSTECDILIMSCHMQPNYVRTTISPKIKKLYKAFIEDGGVDIVHGHSPHHVLPIECYKGGVIMYSLGDLIDDYAIDLYFRNDLAALVEVEVGVGVGVDTRKRRGIKRGDIKIYPTKIEHKSELKKNPVSLFKCTLLQAGDDDYKWVKREMGINC